MPLPRNKDSVAASIDWEKLAKSAAEAKKLADSIERNMIWSKIDVSSKPEEASETIDEEDDVMDESSKDDNDEVNADHDDEIEDSDDGMEEFEDEEESTDEDSWDRIFWNQQNIESSDDSNGE